MADRIVADSDEEVPEIPELLEKVLTCALDEAKEFFEKDGDVIPFTVLAVKDKLFIETHPAESSEECFGLARHTVEHAQGAQAYAFCYDGYIEVDEGVKDALIAEGGMPGAPEGFAICYLYEADEEGVLTYEEQAAYLGAAPNFMSDLQETLYEENEEDSEEAEDDL